MTRFVSAALVLLALSASAAAERSDHNLILRSRASKGASLSAHSASSGRARVVPIPVEKGHGWHDAPAASIHSHIVGDKSQFFIHYSAFDENEPLSDPAAILQNIVDVVNCDKEHIQYVPQHTYIAMMTQEQAELVQQLPFVLWVGKVKPEHKFDDHVFSDPHKQAKHQLKSTGSATTHTLRSAPGQSVVVPHIPLLGIHRVEVLIHPGAVSSRDNAVELARAWSEHFNPSSAGIAFQSVEADEPAMAAYAVSPNIMHFAVAESRLNDVVGFLSHQEQVQFVFAVEPAYSFNYESTTIIQTNKVPTDTDPTRIFSKGITGANQVIGVGDSGLDYRNCLFYDTAVDLDTKICSQCNLFSYYTTDLNALYTNPSCIQTDSKCTTASGHRKIKGYYAFLDAVDPIWGHGSHVAGTVGGKARSGSPALMTQYNGNAPDAQLVISDLNSESILQSDGAIASPPDLSADYFQFSYRLGARVHTNSWGSSSSHSYASSSLMIDRFTYQHKDMLVLFAAGNDGNNGFSTVSSQAQAKNILTVGSSNTDATHRVAVFNAQINENYLLIKRAVCTSSIWNGPYKSGESTTTCGAVQTFYSGSESCATLQTYYCNALQSQSYCDSIENGKGLSSSSKEYGIANALPYLESIGPSRASCNYAGVSTIDPTGNTEVSITGIASYSSRGPTSDGRLKPEVVAPGNYIVSSRAAYPSLATDEFCSADNTSPLYALAAKSGTSMATPGVAGAAALVRQYFAEGYGACGQADSTHSPTYVSAALLKATLVHSGVLITGPWINSTGTHTLGSDPSHRWVRGFGLTKLSSVLRFTDDQYELLYYDVNAVSFSDKRVATGVSKTFTVSLAANSGPLKVTLVWSDPPPAGVSGLALVNDLDLTVTDPSNTVYYGNHFFVSNSRDSVNTVEQVRVNTVSAGTWTITVTGYNVPIDSPSDYALIITYQTPSQTASQYPLCSVTPAALPGPSFTTAPTVSDADTKTGRTVIVGSLSVAGKVYYAAVKRNSASPPLSPYQLSHFLFGNGNAMDSTVVKGTVNTAGSNSFTVEVSLPAGRWTVYLVAADNSDVTQAEMTALDAFASAAPRTLAGWLLSVALMVLGTAFALLF